MAKHKISVVQYLNSIPLAWGILEGAQRAMRVALNREVTQRARYAETKLQDGDKLEIVHPMGGG